MKKLISLSLSFCFVVLLSACTRNPRPATTSQSAAINPDEMQKLWLDAATPSQAHKVLEPLVGKWTTEVKMWTDPTQPPEVSNGRAEQNWALGGRFVAQHFRGQMAGQNFEGLGLIGFNNVEQRYVSTWSDTMYTGIVSSQGYFDPNKNTIEMNGEYTDPLTKLKKESRSLTRIIDNDTHVYELYEKDNTGQEVKNLEVLFKRVQ